MTRRFIETLLCAGATLSLLGCGGPIHPVQGQVVFDDGTPAKELAGYYIMMQSEDKKGANGVIQPDGSFTMGSLTNTDGALLGKQHVAIARPAPELGKPTLKQWIPERYASYETSNLEIEVKPGTNRPTITVEKLKS